MKSIRRYAVGAALASCILAAPPGTSGCANPTQAVNGVFTTEQIVCMVAGMTTGALTGTAQKIAAVIEQMCPTILPSLTQDVISFIDVFQKMSPAQKDVWVKYAAEHATTSPATSK